MLSLRQLACFVAVAETETVADAAGRLNISASPLSRQIQSLEARLGCQLFERSRQRLWLTQAGRLFLEEARELLAHAARAEAAAQALGRGDGGHVAIGYVEAAVHRGVLAGVIGGLRQRFPSASVALRRLRSAAQAEALRERKIDCGLLHTPPEDDGLISTPLGEEPLRLVLPRADPIVRRRRILPQHLVGKSFIARPEAANPQARRRFLAACEEAGFRPDVRFEADDLLSLIGLVEAGLGVGLVQASLSRLGGFSVVFRPLPWLSLGVPLHFVRRRADQRKAVLSLEEAARQAAQGVPD